MRMPDVGIKRGSRDSSNGIIASPGRVTRDDGSDFARSSRRLSRHISYNHLFIYNNGHANSGGGPAIQVQGRLFQGAGASPAYPAARSSPRTGPERPRATTGA